jgi:branched-chain amino acid transport system ATP-binding protein
MRLEIKDLHVHYGKIEAIKGVSVVVNEGEIVTLIGANGAGKTTMLKTISGLRPVSSGQILFDGQDISKMPAHERVDLGLSQAPEGRGIFPGMTVLENLEMGKYHRKDRKSEGRSREGLSLVPTSTRAHQPSWRNFVRWRAADARYWSCTYGSP